MQILRLPRLLVEENERSPIFHVDSADRTHPMNVLHRNEVLDLVLIQVGVEYLQSERIRHLGSVPILPDVWQFHIDLADFVHDDHEFGVGAEEGPLQDDGSEGKSCALLEDVHECVELREEHFELLQRVSQGDDLVLVKLREELAQVDEAGLDF